ncbi:MarR family winged helix-turn-helix transcriptional regulator [Cryptosporangium sp. NPDC048952]|uniref:MarR family winged helix-turn-helix transcriptional regulator n=1 Tax=Cryptosporangium sp. NPDC048952 TaxID=3363961 RepID=UPI0037236B33
MADSSVIAPEQAPATPDDTVTELGRQLARFGRAMVRHKAHQAASVGEAASAAYGLLFPLAERPQRAGALAEAVHADPSTVSRQIAQLVDRGLVERQPDPADGRACVLVPTESGHETMAALRRRRDEHLAAVLQHWPAEDVHELVDLLSRFITDFETTGAPAEPR